MLLQFRGYSTGYKIDRQKFIRFACEHTANQKLKNKLQDVSHIEKLLEEKKIWKSNLQSSRVWWGNVALNLSLNTLHMQSHYLSFHYHDYGKLCRETKHFKPKPLVRHLSRWWTILLISFPFLRCQRANEREKNESQKRLRVMFFERKKCTRKFGFAHAIVLYHKTTFTRNAWQLRMALKAWHFAFTMLCL